MPVIPSRFAAAVVRLEDPLPIAVRRFFGSRIFAVLEKTE
jgi:hypothetical protein